MLKIKEKIGKKIYALKIGIVFCFFFEISNHSRPYDIKIVQSRNYRFILH